MASTYMNDNPPFVLVGQDVGDVLVKSRTNLVKVVCPIFLVRECLDRVRLHDIRQIVPKQIDSRLRKVVWQLGKFSIVHGDQRLPI